MIAIISAVLQILHLLLKNWFEKDEQERKRKESLREEASKAILSRDVDRMATVLDKLHNH